MGAFSSSTRCLPQDLHRHPDALSHVIFTATLGGGDEGPYLIHGETQARGPPEAVLLLSGRARCKARVLLTPRPTGALPQSH